MAILPTGGDRLDNEKKSFWDRPYRDFDHLGPWISFGVFVIIFSIVVGLIARINY